MPSLAKLGHHPTATRGDDGSATLNARLGWLTRLGETQKHAASFDTVRPKNRGGSDTVEPTHRAAWLGSGVE